MIKIFLKNFEKFSKKWNIISFNVYTKLDIHREEIVEKVVSLDAIPAINNSGGTSFSKTDNKYLLYYIYYLKYLRDSRPIKTLIL